MDYDYILSKAIEQGVTTKAKLQEWHIACGKADCDGKMG